MYVIFPADEVILLSYGFATNPRFNQSRPTLDHLREPIIPISLGTRPSTTTSSQLNSSTTNLNNDNNNKDSLTLPNNVRSTTLPSPTIKNRDYSPSVSFADDFMNNKSRASVVDENTYRTGDYYNSSNSISAANKEIDNGAKKKSKLKSKISRLSLGKLGGSSKITASNEQLEAQSSTRVTEDHNIRIANPTFTRDNLRQKNYDAFFASGEPVYSLERKERLAADSINLPLTPQSFGTTIDTPSSFGSSSSPLHTATSNSLPFYPNSILSQGYRESSVSPLPPQPTKSILTKQSSSTTSAGSSGSKRPKSAELYRAQTAGESSVKGDRCHENFEVFFFFLFRVVFCEISFEGFYPEDFTEERLNWLVIEHYFCCYINNLLKIFISI